MNGTQEKQGVGPVKAQQVRRYYSGISIFMGLGSLLWSLKMILGEGVVASVAVNWMIAVLIGGFGLYQLYVELRGPLMTLGTDGITLRDHARPRFTKIEWERIQEVRGRGRQISRVAVLVLRDGGQVEVPVNMVLLPKPDKLIEMIRVRVAGQGDPRG